MPSYLPTGWKPEAVIAVGLAIGLLIHKVVQWTVGWFFEPIVRHLRARWEARIQIRKLERYRKSGFIDDAELKKLANKIAKNDVMGALPPGARGGYGGYGGGYGYRRRASWGWW